MSAVPLYDDLSEDYDRFVNWKARLAFELPFFRELFQRHAVKRVLDVACGTGQHAIALAQEGYEVEATDLSQAMVEHARANASQAGVAVRVYRLGFGELAGALETPYDALICLGNSLPHVTTREALRATLADFAQVLKPGGLLVVQNRNFDRVLAKQERFMSPEAHREGDREWVFFRFYDFSGEALRFNVVRLQRQGEGGWTSHIGQTELFAWRKDTLQQELAASSLAITAALGSYRGEAFDPSASGDLILVAQRAL